VVSVTEQKYGGRNILQVMIVGAVLFQGLGVCGGVIERHHCQPGRGRVRHRVSVWWASACVQSELWAAGEVCSGSVIDLGGA
jgi:hypothetical protein